MKGRAVVPIDGLYEHLDNVRMYGSPMQACKVHLYLAGFGRHRFGIEKGAGHHKANYIYVLFVRLSPGPWHSAVLCHGWFVPTCAAMRRSSEN